MRFTHEQKNIKYLQNTETKVNLTKIRTVLISISLQARFLTKEKSEERESGKKDLGVLGDVQRKVQYLITFKTSHFNSCKGNCGSFTVNTRRRFNVYKTFRRRPGRLLNVLWMFSLRLESRGNVSSINIALIVI